MRMTMSNIQMDLQNRRQEDSNVTSKLNARPGDCAHGAVTARAAQKDAEP